MITWFTLLPHGLWFVSTTWDFRVSINAFNCWNSRVPIPRYWDILQFKQNPPLALPKWAQIGHHIQDSEHKSLFFRHPLRLSIKSVKFDCSKLFFNWLLLQNETLKHTSTTSYKQSIMYPLTVMVPHSLVQILGYLLFIHTPAYPHQVWCSIYQIVWSHSQPRRIQVARLNTYMSNIEITTHKTYWRQNPNDKSNLQPQLGSNPVHINRNIEFVQP